ncbi:Peroxisomal biogenesis factor 6, partial [Durusdinium trenchii]
PVAKGYEGKKVSREKLFVEEDAGDDGNYELLKEKFGDLEDDPALPENGFSISENVEEEYEKLMRSTQEELSVMRQPSAEDVAQKQADAQDLKAQIETWAALVEARIHLEPSLGLGHRLPTPSTAGLFRSASSPVAEEAEAVAGEVRQLLAKWMALQEKMAPCAFPKLEGKAVSLEPDTWKMLDARLQSVLDWALQVADEWKESTRLDARRSFK